MNGFLTLWHMRGMQPTAEQLLAPIIVNQRHIDNRAVWFDENIGFACTQHFIAPEDIGTTIPYYDQSTRCAIVADCFLESRDELCHKLSINPAMNDCRLILAAYVKWGTACLEHLYGQFSFVIWDKRRQHCFAAVDQFGCSPMLYTFTPNKHFIASNLMSSFRAFLPKLSVNNTLFEHFVLDSIPAEETCYREVQRLLPAHYLLVTNNRIQKSCYWTLKKKRVFYQNRTAYYEAFEAQFERATKDCLRTHGQIAAHLSGGLDSSSVTAMAAKLLGEIKQPLFGFTAIPRDLNGASYRKNWRYHELDMVKAICARYSNIKHHAYISESALDPFEQLAMFYPWIDQPFRNISNLDWIQASYQYARHHRANILLTGAKGNATISWKGQPFYQHPRRILSACKNWAMPQKIFNQYFSYHADDFLRMPNAVSILRQRGVKFNIHAEMVSGRQMAPRMTSIFPLQFYYGIRSLDPTNHFKINNFCYGVPQWVYMKKSGDITKQRLLAREGLMNILPNCVRFNPYRGEQAADWFLQYNTHAQKWKNFLLYQAPDELWRYYDKARIKRLFDQYGHISQPSHDNVKYIGLVLMRCLSLAYFMDYLDKT